MPLGSVSLGSVSLGSMYHGGDRQTTFTFWSPLAQQVAVHVLAPTEQLIPLESDGRGYWQGSGAVPPDSLYLYQLDGEAERSDPASHAQPQGVHGPSAVVDHAFDWTDQTWQGVALPDMVIYELHVGTFTTAGTFEAMIPRLPVLKELGINTIELMPIAAFPGDRNWGYDGVCPFAVQQSYGGVIGLKKLVDACHAIGMAVILDVVYNHLGPEGNYLWGLGTYFTERYKTPWGSAINYDGEHCDGVRHYFIANALYWMEQFHIDALRLDAVHAIYDFGAKHLLQELTETVEQFSQQQGRKFYLIAESDLNDPRIIRPIDQGGYGIDAQWNDDFHHVLHTLLTGEQQGYYTDFGNPCGGVAQFAKVYAQSFAYTWDYSPHRQRHHGASPNDRPFDQFVIFSQNHDQVGNRMTGDRLSTLVPFEALKLAAATVLLSPSIPLLFMGEEYGETRPFLYFVSHGDPGLIEAVRAGRKAEFAEFQTGGEAPDPQASSTFERSKLNWDQPQSQILWQFYQTLLRFRRELPALQDRSRANLQVNLLDPIAPSQNTQVLQVWRDHSHHPVMYLMNMHSDEIQLKIALPSGTWQKRLESSDTVWGGGGAIAPDILSLSESVTESVTESMTESTTAVLALNGYSVVVYELDG
jgi:maltooligosyltrehalose trehalohydrolase